MVDIQSPTAEIRRGNKKKIEEERRKETTGQKYNGPPLLHRAAIMIQISNNIGRLPVRHMMPMNGGCLYN